MDPANPKRHQKLDDDLRSLLADYRALERMPSIKRNAAWHRLEADLDAPAAPLAPPRTPARFLPAALLLAAAALFALWLRPDRALRTADPADHQAILKSADPPPIAPTRGSPSSPAQSPRSELPAQSPHSSDSPLPHLPAQSPQSSDSPLAPAQPPQPHASPSRPSASKPPHAPTPPPSPPAEESPQGTSPSSPAPSQIDDTRHGAPSLDLEQELALLRSARDALARHDTAAADEALAEHARRFPAGHLREERLLLRVEALCAAGARDDARREATDFARRHPASPHARKILRVCP